MSGRSELSFDDCVRLDLFYIENWSLAYDLYILAKTLPVLVSSRRARTESHARTTLKVMFVCSSGGHLTQLYRLKPGGSGTDRRWVTVRHARRHSLLAGETVAWAHYPTTRNIPNAAAQHPARLAPPALGAPDVVVSDGAGVALPFFVIAKVLGAATVYLEVYDRIDSRTLTGRLCAPFTRSVLRPVAGAAALYPGRS